VTAVSGNPSEVRLQEAILVSATFALPLAFLPWLADPFAFPKIYLLRVTACLALALFLSALIVRRRLPEGSVSWRSGLLVLILLFVLLNLIALLASSDPATSFVGTYPQYQGFSTILLHAYAFLAGCILIRAPRQVEGLFIAVGASALVVASYALIQAGNLDRIQWSVPPYQWRAFSTLGQPNHLAAFLVMAIPLVWSLMGSGREERRTVFICTSLLSLMIVAVVLSISRTGNLVQAATLSACLLLSSHRRQRTGLFLSIGFAVVVVVSSAMGRAAIENFYDRLVPGESIQSYTGSRLAMWKVATEMSLSRPFTGIGQDLYQEQFLSFNEGVPLGEPVAQIAPEDPHNRLLAISSSSGIPSLVVYLLIVAMSLARLMRFRAITSGWERDAATALMLAISAHAGTDFATNADVVTSWLSWLFMGVALGLTSTRILERSASKSGQQAL